MGLQRSRSCKIQKRWKWNMSLMEWPVVSLSNMGKLILFVGLVFFDWPKQKRFTPGEIQPSPYLDSPDPSPWARLQKIIRFFASVLPLDPLSRGDRGSLNSRILNCEWRRWEPIRKKAFHADKVGTWSPLTCQTQYLASGMFTFLCFRVSLKK